MNNTLIENAPAKDATTPAKKQVEFNDFDISDKLKQRLAAAKFVTPTPVQAEAIPPALEGHDVLATAATGTGKTLSFHPDDRDHGRSAAGEDRR